MALINKGIMIENLLKSGLKHVTYNEYFEIENKNVFAISPNKDLLYISINNTFHVLDMCNISCIKDPTAISIILLNNSTYIDFNDILKEDIFFKDLLNKDSFFVLKTL